MESAPQGALNENHDPEAAPANTGNRIPLKPFSFWKKSRRIDDGRYGHFKPLDVTDFVDGYPRLAALMDSDINTRLYRRFGIARNRLLLHKQDKIIALLEKLDALDKEDDSLNPERITCRRFDEELGSGSARNEILQSLDDLLKSYDDILLREHAIASLDRPTKRNHRYLFDWVYNNKPVVEKEYQYLYDEWDFVLLGSVQDRWLRSVQEKIWSFSDSGFLGKILKSSHNISSSDAYSHYTSNRATALFVNILLAVSMTLLLLLPILLLYLLPHIGRGARLVILMIFVLGFALSVLVMGTAKKGAEAFAAIAAYAAVLVVFIGSTTAVGD